MLFTQFLKMEISLKGFRPLYLLFQLRDWFISANSVKYERLTIIEDGVLVGYCIMYQRVVHKIVVNKNFRHKGHASSLIPSYANFVKAARDAIGFYEKIGFKVVVNKPDSAIMIRD